jgi:hypothetical protein
VHLASFDGAAGSSPIQRSGRTLKPDESRLRAGVALGGPIQHDKTFYYVAGEQELARGEDANDIQPVTVSQINSALQKTGPLKSLTLRTGFLPTTDQETELSGRIDHILTAKQSVMLRYAFTNTRNVNDAFHTDELSDRTARGSSFTADNSLNGSLSSTFSSVALNKLSFEVSQRGAVERTGTSTGPVCSFRVLHCSVHHTLAIAGASRPIWKLPMAARCRFTITSSRLA